MNTKHLKNMQCPKCKHTEPFKIAISTITIVYDDGTKVEEYDNGWDEDDYCECYKCHYHGTVKDFYVTQKETIA